MPRRRLVGAGESLTSEEAMARLQKEEEKKKKEQEKQMRKEERNARKHKREE